MRKWFYAIILGCTIQLAEAEPSLYHAGVARITATNATQADVMVFYPTEAPEVAWQAGPYTVEASLQVPGVAGQKFPVLLLSHGHLGSPLSHRQLASMLARNGFIVVAPTHYGDSATTPAAYSQIKVLRERPRQAQAALEAFLQDARFAGQADTTRIGMIGYSAGGYTALILVGAQPDFNEADRYCRNQPQDFASCGDQYVEGQVGELSTWKPLVEPRLKALILIDPLAVMFNAKGLAPIHIPTLLMRPQDDSYLSAPHNSEVIAKGMNPAPQTLTLPGRHFVFVDLCPGTLSASYPLICKDEAGVDRAAVHQKIEAEILRFLREYL
ncbi:alpha/beta hydrolase family protein [Uliginosibacterium gangwonense]|uniref:alpha/beta hydrolase family protein n=1 Tax=Uliginosibacterium gangwonense TaxID=392736 RepID=UPI00035D442A|nr:dienelactone hydrolase family protein [Uliginosibacterium gangwonense]